MLCTQGSAENQHCAERTPCLNITITITFTQWLIRKLILHTSNYVRALVLLCLLLRESARTHFIAIG